MDNEQNFEEMNQEAEAVLDRIFIEAKTLPQAKQWAYDFLNARNLLVPIKSPSDGD